MENDNDSGLDLADIRVLLVEDEPLVAIGLADQLTRAGATVVGPCSTTGRAIAELGKNEIDVAIIDYVLADDNSEQLQLALEQKSVPFVVVTGYPRVLVRRDRQQHVVSKPISSEALATTIRAIARNAQPNAVSGQQARPRVDDGYSGSQLNTSSERSSG